MSSPPPACPDRFTLLRAPTGMHPTEIRIEIDASESPPASERVLEIWAEARDRTPRLFNAPVLSFTGIQGSVIHARRDTYQRLTAQSIAPEGVQPRVRQLSVTGFLLARDHQGVQHTLLGRRSDETRIYGGSWEFAPGGGIDAPPVSVGHLDGADVFRQLLGEISEELDLPSAAVLGLSPGPIVALAPDAEAGSIDLVMKLELLLPLEELMAHTGTNADERWEYQTTRWVPLGMLPAFAAHEPLIPPAREMIEVMLPTA